jgi:hypothetical protein
MNPKFCIDEVVAVDSAINSLLNTDKTLILDVKFFGPKMLVTDGGVENKNWGFWYKLSHINGVKSWVGEDSLRRSKYVDNFQELMAELEI